MHRLQTARAAQGRWPVLLRQVGGLESAGEEVAAVAALGVCRALSASARASFPATQISRFGLQSNGGGSQFSYMGPRKLTNLHGRAYYAEKKSPDPLSRIEAFPTGRCLARVPAGRDSTRPDIRPQSPQSSDGEPRTQKRRSRGNPPGSESIPAGRVRGATTQPHERASLELQQLRGRGPLAQGSRSNRSKRRRS
jgi:hypothetical protein